MGEYYILWVSDFLVNEGGLKGEVFFNLPRPLMDDPIVLRFKDQSVSI